MRCHVNDNWWYFRGKIVLYFSTINLIWFLPQIFVKSLSPIIDNYRYIFTPFEISSRSKLLLQTSRTSFRQFNKINTVWQKTFSSRTSSLFPFYVDTQNPPFSSKFFKKISLKPISSTRNNDILPRPKKNRQKGRNFQNLRVFNWESIVNVFRTDLLSLEYERRWKKGSIVRIDLIQ